MSRPGDENAFPFDDIGPQYGLSKREYFAGRAMQGIMTSFIPNTVVPTEEIVKTAIQVTDALIKELNKGKKNYEP